MRKYLQSKNDKAVNKLNSLRDKNKSDLVGILIFIIIEILALLFVLFFAP